MKKLLLTLGLVTAFVASVMATDFSVTVTNTIATNILTGQMHLTSLEVINNNGGANVIKVYDAPSTNTTWSSSAYTNWTTYTTNIVVTITNYNGVVETSTNLATYTIANAVGAGTPSYRLIKTFNLAAAASSTWEPVGGVYLSYGLMLTNSVSNITANVTYSSVR